MEIQVPSAQAVHCRLTVFFWPPDNADAGAGYKEAALQAISYLEGLYGFIVVDYSFQGLIISCCIEELHGLWFLSLLEPLAC